MSLELLKGMGVKIPYKAKYDNFIAVSYTHLTLPTICSV